MSINTGIDVEGFDEIRDQDNLKDFAFFAAMIEKKANVICKTSDGNRIKFRLNEERKIEFTQTDSESIECIIQSIKENLFLMPTITQSLFQRTIEALESRKKEIRMLES